MDRENPAIKRFTEIPPKVLEQISNDPAKFGPWVRSLLAMHIDELDTKVATDPDAMSIGQRMDFMQFLAKLGDAFPKQQGQVAGTGFSISINFPQPGAQAKPLQIVEQVQPAIENDA